MTDREIFFYVYAMLHSPQYRSRYADFLKLDFPRLPLVVSRDLFRSLARLGDELVALHLVEAPEQRALSVQYDKSTNRWRCKVPSRTGSPVGLIFKGPAEPLVERVSWSDNTVWLNKSEQAGFFGIPEAVWNFHIGGYQVCEKWLKDRKGRTLSKEEIAHYHKIVVALSETIRLMKEIDAVIEKHGGWPGAFTCPTTSTE